MSMHNIAERSPEWHEIRRQNVGGSEIAALFRVQTDYQLSEFSLFMVKAGRIPPPPVDDSPGSRIWFGIKLEAHIAAMAAEMHGWTIIKGGYCIDDTTPGMGASLDYIITAPGVAEKSLGFSGPGALQIKNIDWIQHKRTWDNDEPPPHILLQLQHEIACAGYTWGAIVGMVGGNQLPVYHYSARPNTIALIRDRVSTFWTRVGDNKPPLIDGSDSTSNALGALFPPVEDEREVDLIADAEAAEIAQGFYLAKGDFEEAEKRFEAFKNRLDDKMRGRKNAITMGFRVNGVFNKGSLGNRAGDLPRDKIIGARKPSHFYKVKEAQA